MGDIKQPRLNDGYDGPQQPHLNGGYDGPQPPHLNGGYDGPQQPHLNRGYDGPPQPHLNGGYYGPPQPHLNGGYYGPPIPPPPPKPKHRYKTPGCCCFSCIGSCIGSCLRCCGCCILSLIWNILIAVAVILGITALILWLIFRPNAVKFYVADANLNRFSLDSSNNSNLHYDLDLNFTIRNPNQRLGIYYDVVQVSGYYGDQRFGSVEIAQFYQGHKNTTVVVTKMEGQNLVVLGDGARADLKEDDLTGVYRIDVRLVMSVRFKFWIIKSWKVKPKIRCDDLKIPLGSSNSTSGFKFQTMQCNFDFR
ncbi:unnamed protein product [Brassica oleracea var. botrytis]|uniref:Late embryogenesis abundant protein LEA-2 subgroup domain-containing protein n=1 Tax=Brassica oleracea TaxID=3712 RepID=A0A3P6EPN3_BRAOL|nr:unnamed protein product [Brassica oleracea]